jgi:hypothetical protein
MEKDDTKTLLNGDTKKPHGNTGKRNAYKGGNVPQHDHVKFYVDGKLQRLLDAARKDIYNGDDDKLFIITGEEGSGKSVFAMQLAFYLDPTFDLSRICYSKMELYKNFAKGRQGNAFLHDEAFRDFGGRDSLTKEGKELLEILMEMRQFNYVIILCIPDARKLAGYIKDMRVNGLFYIYKTAKDTYKRRFRCWGKNLAPEIIERAYRWKKAAYLRSKIKAKGVFLNWYTVDEKKYREMKASRSKKRLKQKIKELEEKEKKNGKK